MLYCEECRKEKDWPASLGRFKGTCEICNEEKICYDVPSRLLPIPTVRDRVVDNLE